MIFIIISEFPSFRLFFQISTKFILTAGHCTFGQTASNLKVRVASSLRIFGGHVHQVSRIIQHPSYDNVNLDYDFALLELESEIVASSKAQAIALPHADESIASGTIALVSGWGVTQNNDESNLMLRGVLVPIIAESVCSHAYGEYAEVTERMLCAGNVDKGGKDSCQGDSGGPLAVDGVLYGVVSWGFGCAQPKYPGVYGKVSNVREWIEANSNI